MPIVTGIPVGDHDADQLQIRGSTLYVGIGPRTINGYKGPLTSQLLDDFGGSGFAYGGQGNTLGDCAYGGTIAWIKNLDAVLDVPGAANVYSSATVTQTLIQNDDSPYTTQDDTKLVVHSAGTRNPFGLCFDSSGRLWFTNNFNRNPTNGDGTVGPGYPKDALGPDFSHDIQDQLFLASPGADYGYADVNWRGKNPMLTPGAAGYHRVLSTTFDNLFNPGPYTLHDPANPDGLGPSSSADGCGFFYSGRLPSSLYGNIFITRWNDAITEAPNGSIQHTLNYSDLVAVDTGTGKIQRIVSGFGHPIAVLADGGDRLLVADFSVAGGPGAVYALHALLGKMTALSIPTAIPGGTVITATVALDQPTPIDVAIGLSSSDSSAVRVFRAVVVPAGSKSATFAINTYRSHVTKSVTIQATLGQVVLTQPLTITGR